MIWPFLTSALWKKNIGSLICSYHYKRYFVPPSNFFFEELYELNNLQEVNHYWKNNRVELIIVTNYSHAAWTHFYKSESHKFESPSSYSLFPLTSQRDKKHYSCGYPKCYQWPPWYFWSLSTWILERILYSYLYPLLKKIYTFNTSQVNLFLKSWSLT